MDREGCQTNTIMTSLNELTSKVPFRRSIEVREKPIKSIESDGIYESIITLEMGKDCLKAIKPKIEERRSMGILNLWTLLKFDTSKQLQKDVYV